MSRISSDTDKVLKALFHYARHRRDEGVYDFTQIMREYSKYVLSEFLASSGNNFARRFNNMIREYVATDRRYQSKIDSRLTSKMI